MAMVATSSLVDEHNDLNPIARGWWSVWKNSII